MALLWVGARQGQWLRDGLRAARGDNNEMPAFLKALAWRDDCEFPEWESRQQKAYFEQPGLGLRPAKCHPAIKLAADLKSPYRVGRVIQYPADGQKKVGGKRMS